MEITCKNCHQIYKGHYCNNCGQPAETHKINGHFLWHDIQHGLLHFDEGIPYSLKQLFTRPGNSIREFIEGKRVKHFKPLSLVVLLATAYGVLYHYFKIDLFPDTSDVDLNYTEFNEWMATHFSWITIATIPIYTIGTYICFRKQGYNYVELFVLNTFKASQRLFVHLLTFPFILYFNSTSEVRTVMNILYIVDIFLIYWTNFQFFNKLSKTKVFFLSALSHIIFLTCLLIVLIILLAITGKLS
ncbi:DUF3667 domain-containing protein [Flavobacterium psychroterrae]|uniref:DUF3667 domain-containing protein n=1 Tax=Flavobacterium psychroterrae TaxID=2133767 RepID=A0ABS5P8C5_9FLAO|nr:DUF3667 domain-containing protein [Flavobacterium psychroterrae]MBS7230552.1 DUF3667 domain-containing protein [Flavobacterium psychroterrae]